MTSHPPITLRLRRDGDDLGVTLPSLVVRQMRDLGDDLRIASGRTPAGHFPRVARRLLSYHASHFGRPLTSGPLVSMSSRVNGRVLRLTLRNNTSDLHVYREIFLKDALKDLTDGRLCGARTIVDLGSNIGLATAYLACWTPHARFYCVEPAHENNVIARRNADDNGIQAVIEALAVSDTDGEIEFFPNLWWASSSTIRSVSDARTSRRDRFESDLALPSVTVPALSVGSFLRRHDLTHVDVMKMDVEGAEEKIMRANTDWLDVVDTVAIEIHHKYVDPRPVLAAFDRHGLRRRMGSGAIEIFSH